MCSIMTIYGRVNEVKESISDIGSIKNILETKGGDTYKFALFINRNIIHGNISDLKEIFAREVNQLINDICVLHLFSRLTPEMEHDEGIYLQPYVNNSESHKNMTIVHGTIGAVDTIVKDLNIIDNIPVDTDIFLFGDFDTLVSKVNVSGGKISVITLEIFHDFVRIKAYHNGLGLFKYNHTSGATILTNINLQGKINYTYNHSLDLDVIETTTLSINSENDLSISSLQIDDSKDYIIIPLFSGGLDITCATQQVISDTQYTGDDVTKVDLVYFDWGTVATESEINAGYKFRDYLRTKLPNVEYSILPVADMFVNILNVAGLSGTRLIDCNAVGAESVEAESAISYVPFRNTFLLTLAAARAEQKYPHKHVKFVLGANLTEGMIYLDNSEPFITAMNNIVKLGGQACENFSVVAPFVNSTKTKMIKHSLDNEYNINTAFSCYFPNDDGSECGKCGSCILKNTAINKAKKVNHVEK